jgi:NAD(P)-dependent dehydrogenase (short-subunit alcohol dehydrogenase family)
MGRLGNLAELESGLKFLIDSENTYYVGQNLVIDGGMGIW